MISTPVIGRAVPNLSAGLRAIFSYSLLYPNPYSLVVTISSCVKLPRRGNLKDLHLTATDSTAHYLSLTAREVRE